MMMRRLRPLITLTVAGALVASCSGATKLSQPKASGSTTPGTCLREKRCLSARDVADLYRISPLHDRGIRGDGEAVAVIMDSDVTDTDLAAFDKMMNIRDAPHVERITVALPSGAATVPADADQTEATLDVETIRMIAPKAKILLYIAPLRYFDLALEEVIKDESDPQRGARTANFSAGGCSAGDSAASRASWNKALQDAVNARPVINVFVSSGDHGIFDCRDPHDTDPSWDIAVDFPSSSSNAISVGGTFLERSPSGAYLDEAAWENPLTNWATGGGNDPLEPRPDWQRGPGVRNSFSDGHRQLPDVAAPADGKFIWPIVVKGQEDLVGGTSASSPFWAGVGALLAQLAKRSGVDDLGMLNKTFYAIAAQTKPGVLFHDVVRGSNLGYDATPGWDYATGLGSPITDRLGAATVAYLRAHPPSP